jgi:hypothetical protein
MARIWAKNRTRKNSLCGKPHNVRWLKTEGKTAAWIHKASAANYDLRVFPKPAQKCPSTVCSTERRCRSIGTSRRSSPVYKREKGNGILSMAAADRV